jgi:uncharacterized protein YecE (DUF72 family)
VIDPRKRKRNNRCIPILTEQRFFMLTWIGTSGYSYSDWTGPFYPTGTRSANMLPYYSRHFPLVELNFTYYRPPSARQLARLAEQTPPSFQFLVKLPRTLTHEREAGDVLPFRRAVEELHRRRQLLGLLGQLPQACHEGPEAREWIARLGNGLGDLGLAIEFRHRSWARPDVPGWLAERGLDLVSVDVPDLSGLYPRGLVRSGKRLYIRFHSRNAANWYRSGEERYDYDYSDAELEEWVAALDGLFAGGRRLGADGAVQQLPRRSGDPQCATDA